MTIKEELIQYCNDCINDVRYSEYEDYISCKKHKQSCQRFLDDIEKEKAEIYKYYWDEEEARKILAERQCTFSLQTCIDKYGKEEGTKIFNERQEKWQNTLSSKPFEELERIKKAKMLNGRGYSKISQKLKLKK